MTPSGQRGFTTAELAEAAAVAAKAESFVVIAQQNRLNAGFNSKPQTEFAWVGPVAFFMSRSFAAITAGIQIVKMGPA